MFGSLPRTHARFPESEQGSLKFVGEPPRSFDFHNFVKVETKRMGLLRKTENYQSWKVHFLEDTTTKIYSKESGGGCVSKHALRVGQY